jgi:hypothetical protein
VIVRTSPAVIDRVASRLRTDGVDATFAIGGVPASPQLKALQTLGDAAMCEITPARELRWVETRGKLRREASALRVEHHRFFYFAPNPTVGQLVTARTAGARQVVGSVQLSSTSPLPNRPLRPGDVVVMTLTGSATSMAAIDRFASALDADGLHGVPFSTLTG